MYCSFRTSLDALAPHITARHMRHIWRIRMWRPVAASTARAPLPPPTVRVSKPQRVLCSSIPPRIHLFLVSALLPTELIVRISRINCGARRAVTRAQLRLYTAALHRRLGPPLAPPLCTAIVQSAASVSGSRTSSKNTPRSGSPSYGWKIVRPTYVHLLSAHKSHSGKLHTTVTPVPASRRLRPLDTCAVYGLSVPYAVQMSTRTLVRSPGPWPALFRTCPEYQVP
ncbi:uncharacterized protein V1510DRAFT_411585 [Dipodascopsis tothii]|uniref:uncharacterized protein n=1 Tax=Dipodascopsis tothii TaxID=44089 RepID=UPI0034CF2878